MLSVAVGVLLRDGGDGHGLELGLGNDSPYPVQSSCASLLECTGSEEHPVLGATPAACLCFRSLCSLGES